MIVTCPLRIGPPPGLFSARQAPTQAEDNPKGRLEGPGCGALVSQKGGACAKTSRRWCAIRTYATLGGLKTSGAGRWGRAASR